MGAGGTWQPLTLPFTILGLAGPPETSTSVLALEELPSWGARDTNIHSPKEKGLGWTEGVGKGCGGQGKGFWRRGHWCKGFEP